VIAACLKWVDPRPEVDPLTGARQVDHHRGGSSDADQTALEWALRLGQSWGQGVLVITAGPITTEPLLRDGLAAGAQRAIRADLGENASSEQVSAALAGALPPEVDTIVCGAWSVDRGSGSVPAYLAARRHAAQALGLLSITFDHTPGALDAERRLDGGRRERLRLGGPMVLSMESGVRLRRGSLGAVLQAQQSTIEQAAPSVATAPGGEPTGPWRVGPFRPRARLLPAPAAELSARQRILSLTGALVDRTPPRLVHLDPAAAADELLAQLEAWGYR
jgi:electron transfer flavoprotein beta subunit